MGEAAMAQSDDRGSTKMMQDLFGDKPPETPADVAKALGLSLDTVKLLRWWIKGQPRPDWFFASVQVRPDTIGEVAGRLIKGGLVIEGFPIGKPALDAAIINVSNVPLEVRG
jgi:hypothetical protein